MEDFIKWLESERTPLVFLVAFVIACSCFVISLLVLTLITLFYGYWLVPVLIWIVAPAVLLAREYAKHKRGDTP